MPIAPTTHRSTRPLRRLEGAWLATAACAALLALAGCAGKTYDRSNPDWAQAGMPPNAKVTASDGDWQETEAPPPPAFDVKRAIPIEMPPYMTLRYAVDPETLSLTTQDGIVRYVVIASDRAGTPINAFYEGIRCSTNEMKTYARWSANRWEPAARSDWLRYRELKSSYAPALASQGLCRDNATRQSVRDMVRELRRPEVLLK